MFFLPLFLLANETSETSAQTIHNRTLYGLAEQTSKPDKISQVDVGGGPSAIAVNEDLNTVYVVNRGSDSVSIISGENNSKVGEDIRVGESPRGIAVHDFTNAVYVVNGDSESISIISGENNSKVGEDIRVGDRPTDIAIDDIDDIIYIIHDLSDSVSVFDAANFTKGEVIRGDLPTDIAISENTDTVYVVNRGSDSISMISYDENNEKEENRVRVGNNPTDIAIDDIAIDDDPSDRVYILNNEDIGSFYEDIETDNRGSDSISIYRISGENNSKVGEDIQVGESAIAIAVNRITNMLYVANRDSDFVSVFNATNHTKVGEDIRVGDRPTDIAINEDSNTVYVTNADSDGVSIIDGTANKVVAGITFQVNPFNSGFITCNELVSPSSQYFYVWSGTECIAKPNKGFEFLSWEENLEGNSSQIIKVSQSASPLDSILDFFGIKPEEREARLDITKFGTFTANFKELPPAIPPEYLATLFAVVASAFVGSWLTPTVVAWRKAKNDARKMNYYHQRIAKLEEDGRLDENDLEPLGRIRREVLDTYSKGKVNESQYENLRNEISVLYEKIYRKSIDSINNSSDKKTKEKQLDKIKKEIEYAYSEGKISELHYNLLNKNIESFMNINKNKTSDDKLEHSDKTGIAKRSPL